MDEGQKELLLSVTRSMETGESRFFEQVNTTFRWLMATLWASNGGALIALAGSKDVLGQPSATSLALFAAGLVSSLLMGLTNLVYASQAMKPMSELKNAFTLAACMGEKSETEIEKLQLKLIATTKFKWPLWAFGLGSLGCLIAGLFDAAGVF